ncbi:TetR/AcrR family transcriptional regulator [Hoeflea ulvae]|uniref:TetR/AcrR family transcriptional regulator n=1 Tax=Hoeflea ulvae TaxID=2983764 RepID=A0ABT3YF47_9HYPH|nr:TetR/AcrR family transcriptional regulator [Hoeflea ulvae]MCY0094526.1 TetR/AcrR family transcriptional regulator [Hoeflea ulvae]
MKRARPYDRDTALDAAVELFWTKGYHATSLKDLEVALNMKPGSIYAAFSSKQALYLAALERYFETSRTAFASGLQNQMSPLKALSDYLLQLARSRSEDPKGRACMLIKTLIDTGSTDATISGKANAYLEDIQADFAAAFDRAKQIGELPQELDSRRLARRYQSNINALRIELHRGMPQDEILALAEDMVDDLERLRPKPAQPRISTPV